MRKPTLTREYYLRDHWDCHPGIQIPQVVDLMDLGILEAKVSKEIAEHLIEETIMDIQDIDNQ